MEASLAIAIPAGIGAAARQGGWFDRVCSFLALAGASSPGVCVALALVLIFSVRLRWLPVAGSQGLRSFVLPTVTLAVVHTAWILRVLRASAVEVLQQPFIRAAYARGFPKSQVLARHALRPALVPVVNLAGAQFLMLLEGSVLVEVLFAWPGIGRLLVESALARDYPVILGCTLVFGFSCVLVNSAADVLAALLDPRQIEAS